MNPPFPRTYWAEPGKLLAGCYPGDKDPAIAEHKLKALLEAGVTRIVNLMETTEKGHGGVPFVAYETRFQALARELGRIVECRRFPIVDLSVPSANGMAAILDYMAESIASGETVYVHCWGGRGRTGTVVACHLRQTLGISGEAALARVSELTESQRQIFRQTPETEKQRAFVRAWKSPGMLSRMQRKSGALWGSLVGDALGVPVEFMSRQEVRRNPVTGMRGFGTHNQPPGTWSDDSSLLLCSAESLAECGGLNARDLGERFVRWRRESHWTPHGRVFDIGIATTQALARLERGTPPELAGEADEFSNGNGSLMRILPIALCEDEAAAPDLAAAASQASSLTHRHPRSQMACGFYCLLVCALVRGTPAQEAYCNTLKEFAGLYREPLFAAERPHFQMLESGKVGQLLEEQVKSSGYVLHTLVASVWCLLTSHSFEETVLKAVNLGDDTDTTGTVAGGLAGACYGIDAVPSAWKKALARHDDVEALFTRFLATPLKLKTS